MTTTRELKDTLARLAERHGIAPTRPSLPLLDPMPGLSAILVEGVASVPVADLERITFMPKCFGYPLARVPLLCEHRHRAGSILSLDYRDRDGALMVRAEVDDAAARCCPAFSIGAHITAFAIRNPDRRDYYAEVTAATLVEISMTTRPYNPQALVMSRSHVPPPVAFYSHAIRHVAALSKLAALVKELSSEAAPAAPARAANRGAVSHDAKPSPPSVQASERPGPIAQHVEQDGDDDAAALHRWLRKEIGYERRPWPHGG